MVSRHIAFILEQAYGHIIPTLGLAMELMRRGHRVSYAVTEDFAPAIRRSGASAAIFYPIDTRTEILRLAASPGGSYEYDLGREVFVREMEDSSKRRTKSSLSQLQDRYRHDRPDLVVHDDCLDVAGRTMAEEWDIARVRIHLNLLSPSRVERFSKDSLVIILIPKFFNGDSEAFDERFRFVGFIPDGRSETSKPWQHDGAERKTILASSSTGLTNQVAFCRLMMNAFADTTWDVVLSIPGDYDPLSAIDSASIADLPSNFLVNKYSAHLDILKSACLFVGQGGPGSTLEALYSGVPALLIPPTSTHDAAATRVAELGLGLRLTPTEATPQHVRACASTLLQDEATLSRVRNAQTSMRGSCAVRSAADLIESQIS